jgi:ribose transport system permease protein
MHAAVVAAVALGMTLIMISGGIDLSVGYVVSLVTVITALAYRHATLALGLGPDAASALAIAAGLAVGVAAGALNGVVITRLQVMPFVATLGMMGVARGLGQYLSGGHRVTFPDAAHPPGWVPALGQVEPDPAWLVVSPSVWSVLVLAAAAAVLLRYTVLGRHCYAIGSNESTARLCGVNVGRTKVTLYTLAGLATGWAGIIQTARSGAGSHDVVAGLELEVIAAVVIGGGSLSGGQGTVVGTLIGALILAVLENGSSRLQWRNEVRFVAIGVIIIAVAALNQWRERRQR